MSRRTELEVWQRIAGLAQSPSHDHHHIRRVQDYAVALASRVGADTDIVRLAAILHDLGRSDEKRRHGLSSIEASSEIAQEILQHLDISESGKSTIIEAIETHDQPDLTPPTPEGRVLKDADFLAGFGAWGVLRIAMWSGETGRRVDDVLGRLENGMGRRLASLEHKESLDTALREYAVARHFLSELDRPAEVLPRNHNGFQIVLEGISGVGKNTVAEALISRLVEFGVDCELFEEPGAHFRTLREQLPAALRESTPEPLVKALFDADRAIQFKETLEPALQSGKTAVCVRSHLSTAVYQSADLSEGHRILLENDWLPSADLLILLDVNPEISLSRITTRKKPPGKYETLEQLRLHREKYLRLSEAFKARHKVVIDTSPNLDNVVSSALAAVSKWLPPGAPQDEA